MKNLIPFSAIFFLLFSACNSNSNTVKLKEDETNNVVTHQTKTIKNEKQVLAKKELTYEEVVTELNEANDKITKLGNEIDEILKQF